jgi:hypothetical protein
MDLVEQRHIWMLKDRDGGQLRLGCGECLDRDACGGLHSKAIALGDMTCLSECQCSNPDACDLVCPSAPIRFAARMREVHGFTLDNVPIARDLPLPALPEALPIFDGHHGGEPLMSLDFAALPFTKALRREDGADRARTASELRDSFGVKPRFGWVLTGVQQDTHVERTWRLRQAAAVLARLKRSGVVMATTPNFSLYLDAPRHDNLHAMKRIAWMWYLLQEAGIPAALHINGRTEHDFMRWAEFARQHPELRAVAFEFLTGTSGVDDIPVYLKRLQRFAREAGRPLWLLVRGHNELRHELAPHFERVIVLDANPYQKTIHRRAGHLTSNGRLRFSKSPTETPKQLTALLRHNLNVWKASLEPSHTGLRAQRTLDYEAPVATSRSSAGRRSEPDDEAPQLKLFA